MNHHFGSQNFSPLTPPSLGTKTSTQNLRPIGFGDLPRLALVFAFIYLAASDYHPMWILQPEGGAQNLMPADEVVHHLGLKIKPALKVKPANERSANTHS